MASTSIKVRANGNSNGMQILATMLAPVLKIINDIELNIIISAVIAIVIHPILDRCIRLPMTDKVRALNVSNVAAIMIYEVYRQLGFPNMYEFEPSEDKEGFKGADWLEK